MQRRGFPEELGGLGLLAGGLGGGRLRLQAGVAGLQQTFWDLRSKDRESRIKPGEYTLTFQAASQAVVKKLRVEEAK